MTEIQSEVGSGVGRVDLGSAQGLEAASGAGSQPTHAQTVAGTMDARVGSPARDQAASIGAVTDLDEIFRDFNDPRRKWRRLLAEFVGTFFLVLVAAGAPMMNVAVDGSVSRLASVVAPGMMVMAVIMSMGKVSGAHLNPAVSIAFALRGDFPWGRVVPYICTQLLGASAAAYFLQFVLGVSAQNGSTYPAGGYGTGAAFLMEFILTFGLVTVILGTASGAQNIGIIGSLGVGAYIALAGMWGVASFRRVHEPSSNLWAEPGQPYLHRLLGLRGWTACGYGPGRPRRLWITRAWRRMGWFDSRARDARPREAEARFDTRGDWSRGVLVFARGPDAGGS